MLTSQSRFALVTTVFMQVWHDWHHRSPGRWYAMPPQPHPAALARIGDIREDAWRHSSFGARERRRARRGEGNTSTGTSATSTAAPAQDTPPEAPPVPVPEAPPAPAPEAPPAPAPAPTVSSDPVPPWRQQPAPATYPLMALQYVPRPPRSPPIARPPSNVEGLQAALCAAMRRWRDAGTRGPTPSEDVHEPKRMRSS